MKVSNLAERTNLQAINAVGDKDVERVYISDMVSDIITGPKANSILITLQTHKSLIAAANLVNVTMIVVVKGRRPADDVVDLATKAGIGLYTTSLDTWSYAKKLVELGF
jgi:predicted transcriptional regulator